MVLRQKTIFIDSEQLELFLEKYPNINFSAWVRDQISRELGTDVQPIGPVSKSKKPKPVKPVKCELNPRYQGGWVDPEICKLCEIVECEHRS